MCSDVNCSFAITSHCLLILLQKRSRPHSVSDYTSRVVIVGDSGLGCCGPAFIVMCSDVNCSFAITSHCLLILIQKRSRPHSVSDYKSRVVVIPSLHTANSDKIRVLYYLS